MKITAKTIRKAQSTLAETQRSARTRRLVPSQIPFAVTMYNRARRYIKRAGGDPDTVRVEIDGGAVCNAYQYSAESTWLRLDKNGFSFGRTWARKVSGGDFGLFRVSAAQIDDRPGKDYPKYRACDGTYHHPQRWCKRIAAW